ncbi:hypothetical protein BH09MYX1_BH09MYX1_35200 [soil metagenome]
MRFFVFTLVLLAMAPLVSVGCFVPGETTCGQESGEMVTLSGRVVDSASAPVDDANVFVELCDLYSDNPDPAKAHPNYRYGTTTKADGTYSVSVPAGSGGLHVFKPTFRYGFTRLANLSGAAPEIRLEKLLSQDKPPALAGFSADSVDVAAGSPLRFKVGVQAGRTTDPLSEEVLVLEGGTGRARAMAPPSRGIQGTGYPNGIWTLALDAPQTRGTYTYSVSVSSEQCVTSERLMLTVNVR